MFCSLLPRLYRRAALLVGEAAAEDAVHEVYLKLSGRPRRRFLEHPEPYAYAFAALVNVIRDEWRRTQRRVLVPLLPDHLAGHGDGGIVRREAELEVARLLGGLSAREAAAVLLVDMDGYTIDQAADILQVHRGTVSRSRARALAKVRTVLAAEGDVKAGEA